MAQRNLRQQCGERPHPLGNVLVEKGGLRGGGWESTLNKVIGPRGGDYSETEPKEEKKPQAVKGGEGSAPTIHKNQGGRARKSAKKPKELRKR